MTLSGADLMAFLSSDDLDRARRYFSEVIGLALIEHDPYACVFDANGTRLRINLVAPFQRPPHTVLGWAVPDGARVAWFKDPDGNTLSLTQSAAGAD